MTTTRRFMRVLQLLAGLLLAAAVFISPAEAGSGFAASNLARALYAEDQPDLRVKVLGGSVAIERTFLDGQWYPNLAWKRLIFAFDNLDGTVTEIDRNSVLYKRTNSGTYIAQVDLRTYIQPTPSGFRWRDRLGNWIDYDADGDILAYGDRNDVQVSFNYETAGEGKRIASIADHFGTAVLFFEYTGTQLTAIRDASARRVQYRYDPDGNLSEFIDVLGHRWTYTYARNVFSDIKCEVRYEHRNGVLVEVSRNCVPVTIVEDKFRLVSRTDPEGRTLTRAFTANAFVGGLTHPDGTTTQYTFDYDRSRREHYVRAQSPGGKVTESWLDEDGDVIRTDVNGRTVLTLVKDSVLRTRTETDARGLKTRREYDQFDNVTKITYPDLTSVSTTYDPVYANVLQKTDERGIITKYEYDPKGNRIRLTEVVGLPEQRITEYTYDAHGQRLTETKRGGTVTLPGGTTVSIADATTTFEYDTQGNVTAIIDAENFRTEFTYDVMGNALTKLDARLKLWKRTFDLAGRLTSETDPLNRTTAYAYDKTGLRTKITDAALNETLYGYDLRGNLATITDPYGGITQLDYNADNQQTKQTDQAGKSQTTEYDLDGRLSKQIDGNGNAIQYIYGDAAAGLDNLLVKVIYPTFSQEFNYDTRGRIIEVIDVLDANTRFTSRTVHDVTGNRIATTDEENRTTTYVYDALGRLATVTDPAGGITTYSYDNRDNLIALTDSKNQTHRFQYDRRNLKIREIRPLGQSFLYTYTTTGQLEAVTDPKGQVKRYTYDDAGRRTEEAHFLTTANPAPVKGITYAYTSLGTLSGYNDGTTQGVVTYDIRKLRKTGETVNYGLFSLSYSYDYYANGQKKSFTGPDNVTVTYAYDANNQLSSIALPTGNFTINQYRWNAPAQITFPGGTTRTQAYDPLLRLTNINVKDPAQNEVMNYQYSYDRADNITQKSTEHGNYSYTYDSLNRLTGASNPSPLTNEAYTYDLVGNRLTDDNIPGPWQYNNNNQLTQAGANISFTYDANGNTTTKTEGPNVTTYIWDTSDRLTEVRDGNSNIITGFYFDPFGRRLWKEVGGNRTYFFYSDEGLIAEASSGGTVTTLYGYQPNSTWNTDPVYLKASNRYYFYQNDHLGTSLKLTALEGTVVWSARAQAFGNAVVDNTSTITNHLRFPGQYFDVETGSHYNHFRTYEPRIGRYQQIDPLGLWGGINGFTYAGGNPLRYTDVHGLLSPADAALLAHFYSGRGGYVDISGWCGDYLKDSAVQSQSSILKLKVDLQARSLVGLKGKTSFEIQQGQPLYVTSIYSFGKGDVHRQRAKCDAEGDGCCVSVTCRLRYYAVDFFDDPIDLCEAHGVCGDVRNLGGKPFWFGLTCFDNYSTGACRRE